MISLIKKPCTLVSLCSALAAIVISLFGFSQTLPVWTLCIQIAGILATVFFLYLSLRVSCVDFAKNFAHYCGLCRKAISRVPHDSVVSTIQTPIETTGLDGPYGEYINQTVARLVGQKRFPWTRRRLIHAYQRLVVVNGVADIEPQKRKLKSFVESVFSEVKKQKPIPTLENVVLGVIDFEHIKSSPLSNMDVLLISDCDFVIALPLFNSAAQRYEWGTSMHLREDSAVTNFSGGSVTLHEVFRDAWNQATKIELKLPSEAASLDGPTTGPDHITDRHGTVEIAIDAAFAALYNHENAKENGKI